MNRIIPGSTNDKYSWNWDEYSSLAVEKIVHDAVVEGGFFDPYKEALQIDMPADSHNLKAYDRVPLRINTKSVNFSATTTPQRMIIPAKCWGMNVQSAALTSVDLNFSTSNITNLNDYLTGGDQGAFIGTITGMETRVLIPHDLQELWVYTGSGTVNCNVVFYTGDVNNEWLMRWL